MLRTLAGMTAATLYVADMFLDVGKEVLIVTKPKQNMCHYELRDIARYYSVAHVAPKHVRTYEYDSAYSAMAECYSSDFIDLLQSADMVFSFDEGLSLIPDTLNLRGTKFNQFYHFPSAAGCPSIKAGLYCNSKYTAGYIEEYFHRNATVLYPVPDPKFYDNHNSFDERDTDILYVGRLAEDKNVDALRYISNKGFSMAIAGSTWYDKPSFNGFKAEIKQTQTIGDLRDLYARSKMLVSVKGMGVADSEPQKREHFGIGVIEAAYSGAVPIVHRSGGPYIDFLDLRSAYGLSYATAFDLHECVKRVLASKKTWQALSDSAHKRSLWFREQANRLIG